MSPPTETRSGLNPTSRFLCLDTFEIESIYGPEAESQISCVKISYEGKLLVLGLSGLKPHNSLASQFVRRALSAYVDTQDFARVSRVEAGRED